jgi:VWA domain containing CoxE-like protein
MMPQSDLLEIQRLRRWRLILGGGDADGTGCQLQGADARLDGALENVYMTPEEKEKNRLNVGKGASRPNVARWLGDIREFFPSSVVRVMQQDALERLGLKQMLLEPEMMEAVQPDVHLVATLLSLKSLLKGKARDTARVVVRKVVEELERKLANPTRQAVMGSLNRAARNNRPKHNEIDWNLTIRVNLKHYQAEYRTIVPERRIGYGRKRSALRDIILCVDQSGSMASSVVYAGIFGAVLASMPALRTKVVVYDTSVVDLTDQLSDPVEVLFGTQLGGGNDTPLALRYCQTLLERPQDTIFVLISDLYEGYGSAEMLERLKGFVASGVQVITLLALSDDGRPSFDQQNAAAMAAMGIPVFACTPDKFPDLMAAAINRSDIGQWAAGQEIVTARA